MIATHPRRLIAGVLLLATMLTAALAASAQASGSSTTLKLHFNTSVAPSHELFITASVSTSARQGFDAYIMPLHQACPTDDSDMPENVIALSPDNSTNVLAYQFDQAGRSGTFSHTWHVVAPKATGSYSVCGYLANDAISDDATYVGHLTVTTSASLACVVPNLHGLTLTAALRALGAAHCALGNIAKVTPNGLPAGRIVSATVPVGRTLKHYSAVALVVSAGGGA